MPEAPPSFRRKRIRLPRPHYMGQRRYFITILCANRRPLLSSATTASTVIRILRETAMDHQFAIYTYCAMPDHLHFLAVGLELDCDLLNFVMHFKRSCTTACASIRGPLWHRTFYDCILRDDDSNGPVAGYIRMNPVRKGLCVYPEDFPFTGSFVEDHPDVYDVPVWTPPWRR